MVDRPIINPQSFSKRQAQTTAPDLSTAVPSLRNVPSVQNFASQSVADTFVQLAQDSGRLEAIQQRAVQVSTEQAEFAIREVKSRQAVEAEKVYSEASLSAIERINAVRETVEDSDQIPTLTAKAYDDVVSKTLERNLSPYQKDLLQQRFNQQKSVVGAEALDYQNQLNKIETEANLSEILRNDSVSIYNKPNMLRPRLEQMEQALRDEGLSQAEITANISRYKAQLTKSAIQGEVAVNPEVALQKIKDGQFDDLINGPEKAQYLDFAKSRITANSQKRTVQDAFKISALEQQIKADPDAFTQADLEDRAAVYGMTFSETKTLANKWNEAKVAKRELEGKVNRVLVASTDPEQRLNPANPDDVNDVDEVFEKVVAPELPPAENFSSRNDMLVNWVDSIKVVPTMVGRELKGAIEVGSVEERVAAVDLVNKLDERGLDVPLNPEERAFYTRAQEVLRYKSGDKEEALRIVEQEMSMADNLRSVRETSFSKEFDETKAVNKLKKALGDGLFSPVRVDEAIDGDLPQEIVFDVQAAAKQFYLKKPDMDQAIENAIRVVKPNYKVTEIDGAKRAMKMGPEKFLPPVLNSHDYLQEQLANDVKSINPNLKPGDYYIATDAVTMREVSSGGMIPSYAVWTIDDNGVVDRLKDEDGRFARYQPAELSEDEKQALIKEDLEERKKRAAMFFGQDRTEQRRKSREFLQMIGGQ